MGGADWASGVLPLVMAAPLFGGAPAPPPPPSLRAHRALCEKQAILWHVTVAVDEWGNIVWVCPVLPGTSADVKIWDKYGPQRTEGCLMEFEVGVHDGACTGRLHSHVPFIGHKTVSVRQKTSYDIHGYCRAWVEHLFTRLWSLEGCVCRLAGVP